MFTVAEALVLPPVPAQVKVYAVLAVTAPVEAPPLVDSVPLQPPEASQTVAFVELQVSVDDWSTGTLAGFGVSDTVGGGGGGGKFTVTTAVAAAVPPAPVQVNG
jgi:hypothetical protein